MTFNELYSQLLCLENLYSYGGGLPAYRGDEVDGVRKNIRPVGADIFFHDDINNADKSTSLGAPSQIDAIAQDNTQPTLIAKFVGEWNKVAGSMTEYIGSLHRSRISMSYIGYRIIDDSSSAATPRHRRGIRPYTLGAIKGTANIKRLQQKLIDTINKEGFDPTNLTADDIDIIRDAVPEIRATFDQLVTHNILIHDLATNTYSIGEPAARAATYQPLIDPTYYNKEHYTLPDVQYNALMQKAVNNFAAKCTKMNRRYGVILTPESRSKNVDDICNMLKAAVGFEDAKILTIQKLAPTAKNISTIFNIDRLVALMQKYYREPADTLRDRVKQTLTQRFANVDKLSTATHIRPVHVEDVVRAVGEIAPAIPRYNNAAAGGHLDSYEISHLVTNDPEIADIMQDKINVAIQAKEQVKAAIARKAPDRVVDDFKRRALEASKGTSVLIVDDNINSGDLYKQIRPLVSALTFNQAHQLDFFFLMCRETYSA